MDHERAKSPGAERDEGSEVGETQVDCEVSLYARAAPTPVGKRRQEDVRDRLDALAGAGRIPAVDVEQWPGQTTVRDAERSPAAALYEEFAAAADAADARLEPFFRDRPGVSGLLQDTTGGRQLTLPVVAVAVRRDGNIVGLYPCYRGGTHHRVEDCVDALEAGKLPANLR